MKKSVLFILCLLLHGNIAFAALKNCTKQEAIEATNQYSGYAVEYWNWSKLYASYKRYGHCGSKNSGVFAAELAYTYQDAISYLLIKRWNIITKLNLYTNKDPFFLEFVLNYVNESFSENDVKLLLNFARNKCPSKSKALCKALENKASTSLW